MARISKRIGTISESATLKVDAKAKLLKAEGKPVVSFAAGEPDFPTPEHIVEAAVAAARDPKNHRYTPAAGLPELREAIAAKTLRDSCARGLPVTDHRDQRRQAGRLSGVRHPARSGGRGASPDAVLDDLSRGDQARRRDPRRGVRGVRPGLPGDRRAARGGAHPAQQGSALGIAVEPDRRRVLPEQTAGSRSGRRRTGSGSSATRSTRT